MANVELARPALRLLISSVSFEASPLFPDARGAITKDLLVALGTKKWQFESHDLMVVNDESKRAATADPDSLMCFVGDPPADADALQAEYLAMAGAVLEHLQVARISSFAMHLDWHIGPKKGQDLASWLHEFLGLKAANAFFDAFGGKPKKAEAKFEFVPQEGVVLGVELKPIDAEEAAEESFFEDDPDAFPSEAIELSLWRIVGSDDGYPLDDLGNIWADSYARMMKMAERAGLVMTDGS